MVKPFLGLDLVLDLVLMVGTVGIHAGRRVKQVQRGKLAFLPGNRAHFAHFEGFLGLGF